MNKKYILASLAATMALTANAQSMKVQGSLLVSTTVPCTFMLSLPTHRA